MTTHFGAVPAGSVLPVHFGSYNAAGASVALTGLAVTDVEIYKGTTVTQRSSDAGIALIDTDGIDIDGIAGANGFSIDTGDNTDSGFYSVGSFFNVWVSAVTIDSQTVNFLAATFRLVAAEGVAGVPKVDLTHINAAAQTATLDTIKTETASILTDTAEIGTAGAGLTNINLPNQTMDIVGNITGNVSGSVGSVTGLTASNLDATISSRATAADLATVAGYLDTEIAAIKAKTDLIPGTTDGKTFAEIYTLMAAVLLGKASGLATTTAIYRAIDDSKDRVTATVDGDGNRSAVTLDAA